MKKNWFISLLLAVCCVCFSACGAPHEHELEEEFVPATCAEEGYNRFVCDCGYSYKGKEREPKPPHTGLVKCTVCDEDYFAVARDIIIEKGKEVDGVYTYNVRTTTTKGEGSDMKYIYTAKYDSTAKEIVFQYDYLMDYGKTGIFYPSNQASITIVDPTVDDGMLSTSYAFVWKLWTANVPEEKISMGMGTLNAMAFKQQTEEVSFESSVAFDVMEGFEDKFAKSWAAENLKEVITGTFTSLFKNSKSGVTVKDFGFVDF